jgi:hypothetical protein
LAKEWQMHNILFLRRRFPGRQGLIVGILFGLSAAALAIGLGLLLLW